MSKKSQVETRPAHIPDDLEIIKKLWLDYLVWGNAEMQERYGVHPHNPEEAVDQDLLQLHKFQPPHGQFLIAVYNDQVCGL